MNYEDNEWLEDDYIGWVYDDDGEPMFYVEDGWVCDDPFDI